jgi:hypothetical protein
MTTISESYESQIDATLSQVAAHEAQLIHAAPCATGIVNPTVEPSPTRPDQPDPTQLLENAG